MQTQLKQFLDIWGGFNAVYERIASRLGITDAELYVYQALEAHHFSATNSQLVSYTGFSKQTISAIVHRLVKSRLVELRQDLKDGRKKIICLTHEGQEKIGGCLKQVHEQELSAMNAIGLKKMRQLNMRMAELLHAMQDAEVQE